MENELLNTIEQFINDIINLQVYFSVICFSYLCIQLIDWLNKELPTTTIQKRLVTIAISITSGIIYYNPDNVGAILNGVALAIISYDWAIKELLKKFNIGYKDV